MRHRAARLFGRLPLLALLAFFTPARAQASDPEQDRCPREMNREQSYLDRMEGPDGSGGVFYLLENRETPVRAVGVQGFGGGRVGGRKGGLVITCALVRNTTPRAVREVTMSWTLTERDTERVVLRGDLPPVGVEIKPGEAGAVNFDDLFFSEVSLPLLSGGRLDGTYFWRFRVSRAVYEDGSVWEEKDAGGQSGARP